MDVTTAVEGCAGVGEHVEGGVGVCGEGVVEDGCEGWGVRRVGGGFGVWGGGGVVGGEVVV